MPSTHFIGRHSEKRCRHKKPLKNCTCRRAHWRNYFISRNRIACFPVFGFEQKRSQALDVLSGKRAAKSRRPIRGVQSSQAGLNRSCGCALDIAGWSPTFSEAVLNSAVITAWGAYLPLYSGGTLDVPHRSRPGTGTLIGDTTWYACCHLWDRVGSEDTPTRLLLKGTPAFIIKQNRRYRTQPCVNAIGQTLLAREGKQISFSSIRERALRCDMHPSLRGKTCDL